ncbi:MAG: Rne/Rng family ribonuclease [Phascolarctobacterium sp.]|nr:Rne/Rng family ribonuclease [Phascolarctobacterium sp.]
MALKIIIGSTEDETRMGLMEDGRLIEYMVERAGSEHLVGSIFKGRVCNVVRGIQAAFVDIGLEQNAFLYLGDDINVAEGQSLLVQISKDARGLKGPMATRDITLPGKYTVLLPNASYIGVSRKIMDKEERERLIGIYESIGHEEHGIIVRTAAAGIGKEILAGDVTALIEEWRVLCAREKMAKAPALLRRELDLPIRMVRDYLNTDLKEIIIDSNIVYKRVKELLDGSSLGKNIKLILYEGKEDIFTYFGCAAEIESISARKITLPNGGYLVIDATEAMTVIDVNSGKFSGRENLEETITEINRQAAVEIARQLRLRDIGGIIVVDFIDMHSDEHKEEILNILGQSFIGDRMNPKVHDITVLNLVEITRKKSRQNLSSVLYTPCPVCGGSGRIESRETLALKIKCQLREFLKIQGSSKSVLIETNPWIAEWLRLKEARHWERQLCCSIQIKAVDGLNADTFMILDNS